MWTHRIILESLLQEDNSFVTLTYEEAPLLDNGLATLRAKDLQDWLKRLRHHIEPKRVRYFGVGEYGDTSFRPHYHVALFGWPSCRNGMSHFTKSGRCCGFCEVINRTWSLGHVLVGQLTLDSAQYIAGYVTKKLTAKDDERLQGREPEFARMSRVPGIGRDALFDVADVLMRYGLEKSLPDVPSRLGQARRTLPLGRYLRSKLREFVGKDGKAPQSTLDEASEELQPLWESSRADAIAQGRSVRSVYLEKILNAGEGRYNRVMSRSRMSKRRML